MLFNSCVCSASQQPQTKTRLESGCCNQEVVNPAFSIPFKYTPPFILPFKYNPLHYTDPLNIYGFVSKSILFFFIGGSGPYGGQNHTIMLTPCPHDPIRSVRRAESRASVQNNMSSMFAPPATEMPAYSTVNKVNKSLYIYINN